MTAAPGSHPKNTKGDGESLSLVSLNDRTPARPTPPPVRGPRRPASNQDPNEVSKLPMPDDSAPLPMPDDTRAGDQATNEPNKPKEDTLQILTGGGANNDAAGGSPSQGSKGDSTSGRRMDATSVDSMLGRIVVEQGLATNDEVEHCKRRKIDTVSDDDASGKSLAQILVDEAFVTKRQLTRIRQQVEAERTGQQIPGYKVIEKLGAGAMAAVYKAKQLSLDRMVAIKVLPRKFSTNKQFIERFYAEGRAAAQLNHPNIVQAFDVGQAGEFHYFVMEYVEGGTVHDTIVANKRFDEAEALEIAIHIADALQHAHERGLIHRDVKPKNIMIAPSGVAKLADLGLARAIDDKDAALAEKGKAFGTPYYISPEQIRGEVNVGPQADIYSLGATLYHMVSGTVPFNGKNPTEVMQKHLKSPLIPPDHVNSKLSPGISEVIEMMMAKSRRDRYKSCKELLTDLRAVQRGELPPIAHKEAPAEALAALAQAESSAPQQLVADRSRGESPFADARVKAITFLLGISLAYALIMTVVLAMMSMG